MVSLSYQRSLDTLIRNPLAQNSPPAGVRKKAKPMSQIVTITHGKGTQIEEETKDTIEIKSSRGRIIKPTARGVIIKKK
jgi:hypothetical protein